MAVLTRSFFILMFALLYAAEFNYCMEVDFCVPVRVDHQQSGKHPGRREEKINDRVIVFRISAFQQEFYLNLTQDSDFLAPSIAPDSGSSASQPSELRRCFYSGYVNSDQDSYVALSLCKGLHGAFSYRGMEYFISQAGSEGSPGSATGFERTHVIRRRGRTDSGGDGSSRCGVEPGSYLNISGSLEKYRHLGGLGREGLSETVLRSLGRSRRFASVPRFVEVLLVADESMAQFHGDDLKHYLLTLLSVAARLYRHPSILNSINLVVVGFMVLGEGDKGPKVSSNAALTLRNFCSWQRKINKLNDKNPEHWDTAVLFTKQDLCGATTCDTLGMADVGTMCDPKRSCSVIEDDGLPSAFTTAHELGHVFNMPHDNVQVCEEVFGKLKDDHMMSPTLIQIDRHRPWSACSAAIITDFLDRGHGECLLDQPERQLSLPDILPGSSYSLPRQCELAFGMGSKPCPYMQPCSKLWCTGQARGQLVCQTRHFPWADGTSCGGGRVCYRGGCTHRNSTTHAKVDGRWGKWGGFGTCSRTCGGGVQLVRRECDHPVPEHGGKFCQGLRVRYRSCNTDPCLPHTGKTFREEQCGAFNGVSLNTNRLSNSVVWVPKFSGISPKDTCKLICRANGTGYFYVLAPKVVDGTPCSPDTSAVCVQGRCIKAGCDGRIGSSKMFDKCGVCGGDNGSCRRISGIFTKPTHGYNFVVMLPVGASNIDIRQRGYQGLASDENYLAVRDGRGRYLLNGNYVVSAVEKDLLVRGGLLRYSGTSSSLETLRSTRPLRESLTVEVLSVGKMTPPRIRYSFYMAQDERSKEEKRRKENSKEEKSKEGKRKEEKIKEERSKDEKTKTLKSKEEKRMEEKSKEERSKKERSNEEKSNEEKSKEEKNKEEKSKEEKNKEEKDKEEKNKEEKNKEEKNKEEKSKEEKSKEEKNKEEKSKEEKSKEEKSKEEKNKEEKSHNSILMDSNQVDGKMRGMDRGKERREVGRWLAGRWEECSVSCGSGVQRRAVQCQGPDTGAASDCELPQRPPVSRVCGDPCPLWEVGLWSPCSKTCGRGFKRRPLRCITQARLNLPREHCSGRRKPQELDLCNLRTC